ncbi:MAG: threonine synthase [Oscillospiraceae bacterium]|nr:threonine synthase [Oscillospiraceae bacterium]
MKYTSTRNTEIEINAAKAIKKGISDEGGLFVPAEFPPIEKREWEALIQADYKKRAVAVLSRFLTDFTIEEIESCTEAAYGGGFRHRATAPLMRLEENIHMLELWHGPTCAFKDMALQMLPHLMRTAAKKECDGRKTIVLVATSGDTGKAALEGFRDEPGSEILVFFPNEGVSPLQKLQMTTQEGGNVGVYGVRGNFDDAQTGVKRIFTDPEMLQKLARNGMAFSSANSINWGRLVPQIVYYLSAYCDLIANSVIQNGDRINAVVPTGNFGNILAAYYAKKMGVPIGRLICASNKNNVLTDFIRTGKYDRNRPFYATSSPSMDILISSNLERLLFELAGRDSNEVNRLMDALTEAGSYTVTPEMRRALQTEFAGGWCDEAGTAQAIRDTFRREGYLMDTHTAVAMHVCRAYRRETGDSTPAVVVSTANPYKFPASVLEAFEGDFGGLDEFEKLEELHRLSGWLVPEPLGSLRGRTPRFTAICGRDEMSRMVCERLGLV